MIVEVSVVPGCKKFSVTVKSNKVKINLKSQPEKNAANFELVLELSKMLGSEVTLVTGHKSKRKKLLIKTDETTWNAFLRAQA